VIKFGPILNFRGKAIKIQCDKTSRCRYSRLRTPPTFSCWTFRRRRTLMEFLPTHRFRRNAIKFEYFVIIQYRYSRLRTLSRDLCVHKGTEFAVDKISADAQLLTKSYSWRAHTAGLFDIQFRKLFITQYCYTWWNTKFTQVMLCLHILCNGKGSWMRCVCNRRCCLSFELSRRTLI
jgi:hypothetical protein